MRNISKKLVAVGILTTAAMGTSSAMAWGPERTTFTNASPATYVTFNSITDNAGVGNETNFVRVKASTDSTFRDDGTPLDIEPGKTYDVYIYFHNNAASNLNLVAEDTRVYAYFPGIIGGNKTAELGAKISASNANPKSVWDEASFRNTSNIGVTMKYVDGSAKIHLDGDTRVANISEDMFGANGTLIGYDAFDGKVPGCAEYSGYITYSLQATQASVSLHKTVAKANADGSCTGVDYADNITATLGDTLCYRVEGKNLGSKEITKIVVKDRLTTGLAQASSAVLTDIATGGQNINQTLTSFFSDGQNIGRMSVGGAGWAITYTAKVTNAAFGGADCGAARLINAAYADYEIEGGTAGTLGNQAGVTVTKACAPTPPPEMPKTGSDFGELIMTMVVAIAGTGMCAYMLCGAKMMRQKAMMSGDQMQQQGDGEI